MRLICAVCSQPIEESVHLEIDVTHKYEDHEEVEEFYMHELCAMNTIDNWDQPPDRHDVITPTSFNVPYLDRTKC